MNLLFPFKHAFMTPAGDLLLFLLGCIAISLCCYLYFWVRFARQKDLTRCHWQEFKRTEKVLSNFQFIGLSTTDFFGKKQIVSLSDGRYGRCLIFYPEITDEGLCKRFEEYHLLLKSQSHSFFPENMIQMANQHLVNTETQFVKANGETLINFAQNNLDKKLSDAEKEHFLIDLAYMLEALHDLKTNAGESLYHGFLLPSSFYFSINFVQKITHTYLSDYGCAFAMGSDKFNFWLNGFFQGKYIVDSMVKKQLMEYQFIFSPEQRQKGKSITSATDFYSYAALAVYIFTQKGFESISDINWQQIPKGWRVFLKQCLNENPENRPINFLELKEYFNDPDLIIETELTEKISDQDPFSLKPVKTYFDRAIKNKQGEFDFDSKWFEAYQALKEKDWTKAFEIYSEFQRVDANSFDAHLGLALLYFRKGDSELAQRHYQEAKKIDAKKINYFHKLIAFDI